MGSCSKEIIQTLEDDDTPINKDGSIAFRTDSVLTRGTPQDDLKAYSKLKMLVYSHAKTYAEGHSPFRQIDLEKVSNDAKLAWNYTPPMFWPTEKGLSFLGYTIESAFTYATASGQPGVFINGDGKNPPTIEYYVPADVTKQPDLIVTAQLDQPHANNVTLKMKHALACVSFCATGPTDMKVKSLQMKNVYTKGSFQLDDPDIKWTLDKNSKNLVVIQPGMTDGNLEENPGNGNYLMTTNGYLMMLPQKLTNATIDVTYWKGTPGTEKIITYTLPTTVEWLAGKKYIYKFGEDTEEIVVYYEMYADGSIGLHTNDVTYAQKFTAKLDETKEITEAGYGVLTKSRFLSSDTPTIKLGSGAAIKSKKIEGVDSGYNLYAVNQTGTAGSTTFVLPAAITPVPLYFDGNAVESYKIIPHVAKGVYLYNDLPEYSIRTPQQMRNLSALTTSDLWASAATGKKFRQERDLDFSKTMIGGGALSGPVVDEHFGGTYEGKYNGELKVISNVIINAPNSDYVGLFSQSAYPINDITLKSSTITGGNYVGAITGRNYGINGAINRPRVIGTNSGAGKMTIKGTSNVGGISGKNETSITGNTELVAVTEVTVAEVSGWVDITGTGNNVGGIVGENNNKIDKVLVNGVNVENSTDAKINIKGADYVGGITGVNWSVVEGNQTGTGADVKNMPDVAGIVEVTGTNWVGGIAGANGVGAKLNSVNIRLGRATPMKITGTGFHIGGIAGQNGGILGVESTKTFISTRGNIEISGAGSVGGIVGTNVMGATLQNCFVYNFFTQGSGKQYYAPKITSTGGNVGGVVGSNSGSVNNCSVFTADQNTQLTISAVTNAGGICGMNDQNSTVLSCSVIGKVLVTLPFTPSPGLPWEVSINVGGICGNNKQGTHITKCWIGSSDGNNIIENAKQNLGLVITPPDEPGVQPSYGIPTVIGKKYVGGIVGFNDGGIIEDITLADNMIIGVAETDPNIGTGSNWVGGIAGGNTPSYDGRTQNIIRGCRVTNAAGKRVVIQGATNLGGIAGLNNGVIENCEVSGVSGNPLTIAGLGSIGGIVGQVGGHTSIISSELGNNFTVVRNCKVTGYVTLAGNTGGWDASRQVGGITGLLGPTIDGRDNLLNCVVKGTTTNSIIISGGGTTGGIVGKNSGNIMSCDVYNAQIISTNTYAGGITAHSFCASAYPATVPAYNADINDCRVYSATITGPLGWGTWIGLLDTGSFGGAITVGRKNTNYVFQGPAVGKQTSVASVTTNFVVQTPPARP